ncbi:MAG: T9SS type A sorting domain-containing protein [Fidelibacterota bacterium]|nr:MAG: T9SS type A sorting domain-containing protein [Candidatus Neomarinimicrobiota bacterium]
MAALLFVTVVRAQQLAFPGAEGYGRFTTGGRGGEVIEVTNLNDSGPGSLRAAVEASGARTVVFRVSGTIHLNSSLEIKRGDITIAGQTAPGDGICLADYPFEVGAGNVIIRYLRFRLGDVHSVQADALTGQSRRNIIIDHCTASWSVDECVTFYFMEDFTLQWCLIAESLRYSVHEKGPHGYGGIWGGRNCSFHHNLLAHHSSRNPRFNEGDASRADRNIDHRNNVIYNWGFNSAYGGEGGWYNLVNNYYKYGPATGVKNRIVQPSDEVGRWYVAGNYVYGYPDVTADNWAGGVQSVNVDRVVAYDPFPYAPVITHTAENAFEVVLADAGASLRRDSIDARIVHEARTGTATYGGQTGAGSGIIDSQSEVGGWPELRTYDVPVDNDHDGMADDWELANGLDPSDPLDRNDDFNGDGYTNLEKYINSLCVRADYLRAPAELEGATLSHDSIRLSWKEDAFSEYGFVVERSEEGSGEFTPIGVVPANDTSYTDTGLDALTTYHYRVGAFKAGVMSVYSNLAQATTLDVSGVPLQASHPSPADSATDVWISATLTWDNAAAATSYDVYLGTTNPPPFRINQMVTVYEPRDLLDSTIHYWRVDPVNDRGTTTGQVWRFTTEPFTESLIAHWPLDEGSGSLAEDITGNGHWAYLYNMPSTVWVAGKLNSGLEFDGIEDYLKIKNNELINISVRGFTAAFWLRQSEIGNKTVWLAKASFDGDQIVGGYAVYHDADGKVCFTVSDGEYAPLVAMPSDDFLAGQWIMVTAVRDRDDQNLKLYTNAHLLGAVPDSSWDISQRSDLFIGYSMGGGGFLAGVLDEVRIYNYALDSTEISDLYAQGITGVERSRLVQIPQQLQIENHPNPFNPSTLITYTIPRSGFVRLTLFDLLGREIISQVDQNKPAGVYTFRFDGAYLSSGVYYCRLDNEGQVRVRKMLLLK